MNKDNAQRPGERGAPRPTEDPIASVVREARSRFEDREREARDKLNDLERAVQEHEETIRNVGGRGWTIDEVVPGTDWRGEATVTVVAAAGTEEGVVRYDLTAGPDEWSHYVDGPGVEYGLHRFAPAGVVMSPETACKLLREGRMWERDRERREEEWLFYLEMRAERGPGEEPPTAEEVDAALEAYRRRLAAEAAKWVREEGRFVVNLDDGREVLVTGTVLCAECGNPTSVGTVVPEVTDIRGGTLRRVLRPIHLDCLEKLQWETWDLSDEVVVELRDFVVMKHEAEEDDE
ncbi:MAG: hypothetical protein M3Q49_01310 [Actinomycetota bacterium]|nr:hypothetical protein [Actinomycetota bacterium]MDP9484430.1 hypothetical protein [Actinomycetota bacterium]PLS87015.1 MAG: hypothetical protein CYG60_04190 [Actinomycetota bacterium]